MHTHYNETPSFFKTHPMFCVWHCTLIPLAVAVIFLLMKYGPPLLAEEGAEVILAGVFIVLLMLVCAIIPVPVLWLKTKTTRLIVTDVSTVYRTGILSKTVVEVMHRDVRAITVRQSLLQRLLRAGDIQIASAGIADFEITARGFSNPIAIKEMIISYRQQDGVLMKGKETE